MSEELAKAYSVVVAGSIIAGETTQPGLPDELATPKDAIIPPLSLEALSRLSSVSGVRRSCIEAIARNTVGLGVEVVSRDSATAAQDHAQESATLLKLLDALARRDTRMGCVSILEQLFAVKTDEEECGQGYLEVSRNVTTGKIDGLFHLPGKRMRRLRDRTGWVLLGEGGEQSGPRTVRFYNFAEKVVYTDGEDPQPTAALQPGLQWKTNEVIRFTLYSSESRDYGLPRDHALALEYAADKLAAESNFSFFDSSGVPPTLIFISGEEARDGSTGRVTFNVPQETIQRISETVKSDAGHSKTVAIVPLPPGTKVQDVKLAMRSDRDIGNNDFRTGVAGRVIGAFRMAPEFIPGISNPASVAGGRGTGAPEVGRALTLEQVFEPEQTKYERHLDALLDDLGYGAYRIRFKRLAIEGDQARRDSADGLALTGSITERELRSAHGYGPLPESTSEDETVAAAEGKVIKGWNDRLVVPPKQSNPNQTFGGASDGSPFPHADQRGQQPGIGGRQQQSPDPATGTGVNGAALLKHEGEPHVDDAAAMLEVAYLDITEEGIQRAMKRTHTVAEVIAGRVTQELAAANGAT